MSEVRAPVAATPCCPGIGAPKGPEWAAARAEFQPFLDECVAIVWDSKSSNCGGMCMEVLSAKANLDKSWTSGANDYLRKHSLKVEVIAYYGGRDGGHLILQLYKAF